MTFQLNKNTRIFRKVAAFVLAYILLSVTAFTLSYYIRFDGNLNEQMVSQMAKLLPWVVFFQVLALALAGQMLVVSDYYSIIDLKSQLVAVTLSTIGFLSSLHFIGIDVPRGIQFLDFTNFLFATTGFRLLLRYVRERYGIRGRERGVYSGAMIKPIAIVGAGSGAAALIREIHNKNSLCLKAVALFDDDVWKWGRHIHGVPIVGPPEMLADAPWNGLIRRVILTMPNAHRARLVAVASIASRIGATSEILPALDQLVTGSVHLSKVRPIQIDDLLQRPAVVIDISGIDSLIRGRIIAITGAGGSIGSELCRQILARSPRLLLLIERSEVLLFQIEQELLENGVCNVIVPLIADVCDKERIRGIFGKFRPHVVFHAAAHKHVPMMETQPAEAIKNNLFGSVDIIRIACEYRVDRFVMISTDKAVNPTNIMGASKRLAELYLQAFQACVDGGTRFMAVRFGNVLGSSGSVVPTFQKQICSGGPVTVTHPEVTRYFMTIPEAVSLVLQTGSIGEGGEIFVLDMGEPIKIVDLAKQMIELSGYKLGEDMEIKFIGLRSGEKMFEELSHQKEELVGTNHPKIFRFVSSACELSRLEQDFGSLERIISNNDVSEIKRAVQKIIPEYRPFII